MYSAYPRQVQDIPYFLFVLIKQSLLFLLLFLKTLFIYFREGEKEREREHTWREGQRGKEKERLLSRLRTQWA